MLSTQFVPIKALSHCQFHQIMLEILGEYGDVVYHNDIRWLSRGTALQRFLSLKNEIGQFMENKGQQIVERSDRSWLANFAFLVDVRKHLNKLNTSLQGKDAVISQLYYYQTATVSKASVKRAAYHRTFFLAG